jgi:hypothetical protein
MSSDDNCLFCFGTGKRNPHRYDDNAPLERAINESYRYQGLLYQAWRALRAQTKGLQRQRRLIKRLQAERALLVARAENAEAALVAEVAKNGRHAMRVTIAQLEARLADLEGALRIALNQDSDHSPTCECRLCRAEDSLAIARFNCDAQTDTPQAKGCGEK